MEIISGTIRLLNSAGDCVREVSACTGSRQIIEGTFGCLVIDMSVKPPKVQGKGNVWINHETLQRSF